MSRPAVSEGTRFRVVASVMTPVMAAGMFIVLANGRGVVSSLPKPAAVMILCVGAALFVVAGVVAVLDDSRVGGRIRGLAAAYLMAPLVLVSAFTVLTMIAGLTGNLD